MSRPGGPWLTSPWPLFCSSSRLPTRSGTDSSRGGCSKRLRLPRRPASGPARLPRFQSSQATARTMNSCRPSLTFASSVIGLYRSAGRSTDRRRGAGFGAGSGAGFVAGERPCYLAGSRTGSIRASRSWLKAERAVSSAFWVAAPMRRLRSLSSWRDRAQAEHLDHPERPLDLGILGEVPAGLGPGGRRAGPWRSATRRGPSDRPRCGPRASSRPSRRSCRARSPGGSPRRRSGPGPRPTGASRPAGRAGPGPGPGRAAASAPRGPS